MTTPLPLAHLRVLIDAVDDGVIALLGTRRKLVRAAALVKLGARVPARDAEREAAVRARLLRFSRPLGVPPDTAGALASLLIEDGHSAQGLTGGSASSRYAWAWRPLGLAPHALQRVVLDAAMARAFAEPIRAGDLAFLERRWLGIEVSDAGLRWVITLRDGRLHTCAPDTAAEATVRADAAALVMLAGRTADADTLFFQRRLTMTGDTELGLYARNLLDRLPWDAVPRVARAILHRAAGALRDAEDYGDAQ